MLSCKLKEMMIITIFFLSRQYFNLEHFLETTNFKLFHVQNACRQQIKTLHKRE